MSLEFVAYKNPISASLRDLILQETFECVRLGVSKEWLSKNFPEPDDCWGDETAETSNIWRYGNLEFHFYKNTLYMIFTDYVESVDGGSKINFDPWILKSDEPSFLMDWVQLFTRENRDFQIVQRPEINQTHIILRDKNVGPVLSFVSPEEWEGEPRDGNPKLGAIHLWATELMR